MIGHPGKAPLLTNKDGARLKLTAVWRTQEQYSCLTKASRLPNKRDTSAVFISFIQFLLQNLDYLHLKCLSWIHIFNFSQFHLNKKQKPSQRAASCELLTLCRHRGTAFIIHSLHNALRWTLLLLPRVVCKTTLRNNSTTDNFSCLHGNQVISQVWCNPPTPPGSLLCGVQVQAYECQI